MRREEGGRFEKNETKKCYHDVGVEKLQHSISAWRRADSMGSVWKRSDHICLH